MPLVGEDIPELVEGVDARALALTPVEGFILSRIDGMSTASDIADSMGFDGQTALAALERLVTLGALRRKQPGSSAQRGLSESADKRFTKPVPQSPQRPHFVAPPKSPAQRLYDPHELEEHVALDDTRKRRVLDVFYRLSSHNHYELLEIGRDATKDEIRDAYFALSKEFHPDTSFGKELGSYKSKMEKIFTAATAAYDVLSRRARRTDYDATLAPPRADDADWRARRPVRAAPSSPKLPAPPSMPDNMRAVTPDSTVPVGARAVTPVTAPRSPLGTEAHAPPIPSPSRPPAPPTAEQLKRHQELLKLRLAGGRPRAESFSRMQAVGASTPAPAKGSDPGLGRADVLRALAASLRDASHVTGSGQSVRRHLAAAADAELLGDLKGALAALRLAQALMPEDLRIGEQVARLQAARSAEEAPQFEQLAVAEEKAGKWEAAGLAWLRVVEGRPNDAKAAARCANALLEAKLDIKTARTMAQRAVDADPAKVTSRTLLARVYIAAGMRANAKRELEAATKLDPDNEIVKNLLRELG